MNQFSEFLPHQSVSRLKNPSKFYIKGYFFVIFSIFFFVNAWKSMYFLFNIWMRW